MNKRLLKLMIGLSVMVSGCTTTEPAYQPPAEPVSIPARSFMRQWNYDLSLQNDQVQAIHVRPELLVVQTLHNNVYILDRSSGTLRFLKDVTDRYERLFPPLVTEESIIFPLHTQLRIYERQTGRERTVDIGQSISTPSVWGQDLMFFGTDYARGGRIMAADPFADYAHVTWQLRAGGTLTAAPAIHNDVVYFAGEDGFVHAISAEGTRVWAKGESSVDARGPILADLAADDFGVYAAVSNGVLYVLDHTTGKVKWQFFGKQGLRTAPVPGTRLVYQYVPGTGVVAIDKLNGKFTREPVWVLKQGVQPLSEDEQRVYVRSRDNRILAVDKTSGEVVFESKRNDFDVFVTNMLDSTIYAATRGGQLYAITPVLEPGRIGELVLLEQPVLPGL